jgi:hypothetical protein
MSSTTASAYRKQPLRNIIWDDMKDLFLLRGVSQLNCHLKPSKWHILVNNFCNAFSDYRYMLDSESERKNCVRRLRNRFNFCRDECARIMESGNKSAINTPDLSEKFKLMRNIQEQIEKHMSDRQKMKDRRARMGSFEGEILEQDSDSFSSSDEEGISAEGGIKAVEPKALKRKSLISPSMVRFSTICKFCILFMFTCMYRRTVLRK